LHSVKIHSENGGAKRGIYARLEALYACTMWANTEFYMVVVAASTELTKGNTLKPQQTIKLKLQR